METVCCEHVAAVFGWRATEGAANACKSSESELRILGPGFDLQTIAIILVSDVRILERIERVIKGPFLKLRQRNVQIF